MRTDKVILRTILTTLLAILLLFGVMLLCLCFIFPSTMMQLTYELGMDKACVKYAARTYERTDDAYYAAVAFETSVMIDDEESAARIEKYGLILIADDEFATYSQKRTDEIAEGNADDEDGVEYVLPYEQYVYGQVALAQYEQGKQAAAIQTAVAAVQGELIRFPEGNAAAMLYLTAAHAGDESTANTLRAQFETIREGFAQDTAEYAYITALLAIETIEI